MTYESLSVFAQTWGLVYLVVLFAGVLVYALRPSAKKKFEEAGRIPLIED
ncbi:MAG: cbb3-type cytochrome c oxidase subunit 3 [Rhodospirillales bacterium]|jgi:cytochrome c oxidase cbb3-type subunit IV|nr:cbb3-type cytochrome c oxidase subunit 3 [Rhodospirillales bacterium]MBT4038761.1 cbb3-type cytochrome c oxidase subunit 3 [Rhodospirillales bacterium]MBT4627332.1 cbb3-type cytochrome c oxidase subunit 3 [Rhodospirillales bacterium]MBT5353158.1 cbb3-type cytochrome c oxidase subunit 3 [Rhodospirillales bacterium]MBT5521596.1 cbb3-type cytochrome c oxidase subunit 3 [Rhodospirillales bacterium]